LEHVSVYQPTPLTKTKCLSTAGFLCMLLTKRPDGFHTAWSESSNREHWPIVCYWVWCEVAFYMETVMLKVHKVHFRGGSLNDVYCSGRCSNWIHMFTCISKHIDPSPSKLLSQLKNNAGKVFTLSVLWLQLHSSGLSLFHLKGSKIMFSSWINALLVFMSIQSNPSVHSIWTIYLIKTSLISLGTLNFSFHFSKPHTIGTGRYPEKYKAKQRPAENSEQVSFLMPKFSKLLGSLWGIAKRMQKEWNTGKTTKQHSPATTYSMDQDT